LLGRVRTTVGLDIGSSAIKVVEIEQRAGIPRLVNFGVADLSPEAIVEGEIMDRQLVCEAIQTLFESRGIKRTEVATGVSGRGVIVKKITMERLSPQDAREAIHWEAEQHVPYDINDVSLDFEILDREVGPNQMQVLLVAAKRDLISAHADLLREAGLRPTLIDVNSFAVQNATERNYEFLAQEVVALVNVGAELTNVNLVQGGAPLYTQDLSMGGNTFIEGLQKKYQVTRAEASAALHPKEGEPSLDLTGVIKSFCADLGGALERSVVYLKANGDGDHVDRVLLSGGGARIQGLGSALAERLKVPVEVTDPLRRITHAPEALGGLAPDELAPQLTVGIGLALRKARRS
jgi:type IV pilus assembly protein PilM